MRAASTLLLTVLWPGLSACAEAPSFATPHQALRVFLDRSIAGDETGARACLVRAEQPQETLTFDVSKCRAGYEIADLVELEGDKAVLTVRFAGHDDGMQFVLVEEERDWRVSLGFTLARGMTEKVQSALGDLGEDPTPDEIAEAMRRAMAAPAPRGGR